MFVYDFSIKETGNDCLQQETNAATWKDPLLEWSVVCFVLYLCSDLNKHFTAFSMAGHNVVRKCLLADLSIDAIALAALSSKVKA
jgi:hypothetical protein